MIARWMASAAALTLALAPACAVAEAPTHPLDALTGTEINRAVAILASAKLVDAETRYPTITLLENPKAEVLRWAPGEPFERRARADYLRGNRLFEADLNLTNGKINSVKEVKDRQSAILFEEFLGASEVVKKDPRWRAAMRKRGFTSSENIICAPLTVGPVIDQRYRGLRLLKVPCFDKEGAVNNVYGRPIENLLAIVDVRKGIVLDVIDLGVVPVPTAVPSEAYDPATSTRRPTKPVQIVSPQGPNFALDGSVVGWDKWKFHVRVDKRLGPVISRVTYQDGKEARQVAYQMSTAEMFVPYMDPSQTWAYRAYMDIGEYGFGALSSPLEPGSDCPVNARFLDAVISDDHGKPLTLKNVVCIFERDTGQPLWRHYEFFTESHESRPDVELVVRMAPEVGNYDYLLDYAFNRSGEIEVRVGAYGIIATKGVAAGKMNDATAAGDTKYGMLVAPNLVGVNHDHFMSFRVDLDVDGVDNRLVRDRFVKRKLTGNPLRHSLWQVERSVVDAEGALDLMQAPAWYRVESGSRRNAMGNPTSYQLMPGHSDLSILDADEPQQQRAAFSSAALWVSRYNPNETFAAGAYPNQNSNVEGLPRFIADRQSIASQDLVLWYTIGFRHQTRSEDWPVMPELWHSFKIRPFNYFDRNPGLDVPDTADVQK
jgi:primary-amine oxidase